MCDACRQAEVILDGIGYPYRRAMTVAEVEFGDVDRVRMDFDAAEIRVAKAGAAAARRILEQLYAEMRPLVATGDVAAIARVRASHVAELARVFKQSGGSNIAAGKRQVLDSAKKAGVKLATRPLPPGKDVRKARAYLDAKAEAMAEQVAAQMEAAVRFNALKAARVGAEIDEAAYDVERPLVAAATVLGREGYDIGRVFGYDEVKSDVASVVYTAILDDKVCEVCAAADGQEWVAADGDSLDEGFASAPNNDCMGGDLCRCYPILIYS